LAITGTVIAVVTLIRERRLNERQDQFSKKHAELTCAPI
jgi:uncharacterized protein (DUF433 family)